MIRLSTAHAKARLSKNVTKEDARAAIALVQYAYFKKVLEKDKKRRRKDSEADSDVEDEPEETHRKPKRTKKQNPPPGEPGHDPYAYDEDDEDDSHVDQAVEQAIRAQTEPLRKDTQAAATKVVPQEIDSQRYVYFCYYYLFLLYYLNTLRTPTK